MTTNIEWTWVPDGKGGFKKGETVNPQVGCSEVSPACKHCWAARIAARGMTEHHRGLTVHRSNGVHWNGQITRAPDQLVKPLRWRAARGIFWGSMTDLFHESCMATEDGRRYMAASMGVMAATPQHTHLLLTKRTDQMRRWFDWLDEEAKAECEVQDVCMRAAKRFVPDAAVQMRRQQEGPHDTWPLPNVWLGATAEDQKWLDHRVGDLLACPAAVHYLSVEPMTNGRVTLPQAFLDRGKQAWVIAGGESGPGARPSHPDWFRHLRDQCVEAGVPFLFKQWGACAPWVTEEWFTHGGAEKRPHTWVADDGQSGECWIIDDDGNWSNWTGDPPSDPESAEFNVAVMSRVGKKKAGRLLDGRTWDEFPEAG